MSWPRPARVFAIARRDWEQELRGRRGLLFAVVTAVLLVPTATIRVDLPSPEERPPMNLWVAGDVPEAVLALPNVHLGDKRAHLHFRRQEDGALVVRGQAMPREVREALDGSEPEIRVTHPDIPQSMPGRSILFAMISASVLTGAVSESIGGERSRRTLQALLAASVTRFEVVLGKWLAWAGYGGGAGLAAALMAIVMGRVDGGWWLLPLPMVAGGVVALALYLSRHAADVVGGATVSLRYLPAVLAGTGLVAWFLGDDAPLVGASLPIGGALLAAGDTWAGPAAPLVATASSGAFIVLMLWMTARDLEQPSPPPLGLWQRTREALVIASVAALAWWSPLVAPILWGAAGNPVITESLPRAPGVWAGSIALLLMSLVHAGRVDDARTELGLVAPRPEAWLLAGIAGVALAAAGAMAGLVPLPDALLLSEARFRLAAGVQPTWVGPLGFLLAVVAQELLFRGWLQRLVGPALSTVAFVVVVAPLEPLTAGVAGAALASVTRVAGGSVLPAIAARLVWALAALGGWWIAPGTAFVIGLTIVGVLWSYGRYRAPATTR